MFLRTYSFWIEQLGSNSTTFNSFRSIGEAIAGCQKTLTHLAPPSKIQWEDVKATLAEEKSLLCNSRKPRATLFEIDELVISYQRDEAKKLRRAFANHTYHYVLAENATDAIRRIKRSLESMKTSPFHEVVYQECNHRPLCLPDLKIQREEVRQCYVATN